MERNPPNNQEVEMIVKKPTLDVACEFYRTLSEEFYPWGYLVALHGSILLPERVRPPRDIDFVLTPWKRYIERAPVKFVEMRLRGLGFEPLITEQRGSGPMFYGIVGTWHEYAVDITLAE